MSKNVYIVAVSGGVDSVALLHRIMSVKPPLTTYIVAHVDHGIREDSTEDAEFVRELATSYRLDFELQTLALGKDTSEEVARSARYEFLFSLMKKHKAEAVITAHHQDDVIETMIVNIFRGTGLRGLIGFSQDKVIRPFINKTKKDILDYANEHKLMWHEDSTNSDETYLRNHVRKKIIPKLGEGREKLLEIRTHAIELQGEIDSLTKKMLVQALKKQALIRCEFVVFPYIVQLEVMATWLRLNRVEIDKKTVIKAVNAAKTLLPNKHIELPDGATLQAQKKIIVLKVEQGNV